MDTPSELLAEAEKAADPKHSLCTTIHLFAQFFFDGRSAMTDLFYDAFQFVKIHAQRFRPILNLVWLG